MTYELYINYPSRVAKYHLTGCPRVRTGRTRNGEWRNRCADLPTVFKQVQLADVGTKAVLPADCCLFSSTEAGCINCRLSRTDRSVLVLADQEWGGT